MIIRPIILYAAPVWCSAAPTDTNLLQRYQNKCLRLILSVDRYTRISELHNKSKIPYTKDYIAQLSNEFYENQLNNNELTKNITNIRAYNIPIDFKHKLPSRSLRIFHSIK